MLSCLASSQPSPETFLTIITGLYSTTTLFDKPKELLKRKLAASLDARLLETEGINDYAAVLKTNLDNEAATYAKKVEDFHNGLFLIITGASAFIGLLALLFYHLYPTWCNALLTIPLLIIIGLHYHWFRASLKCAQGNINDVLTAKKIEAQKREADVKAELFKTQSLPVETDDKLPPKTSIM